MKALSIAILVLFMHLVSLSQTSAGVTPDMRQEANGYFATAEWVKAAAAYQKIVDLEPANPNARYRLGNSLLELNRGAEATPHLEKAFSISPNAIFAFALARSYARANNRIKAFETLEKSTTMGGISPEKLTGEKDFAAWKDDAQFKELVRKSDLAVNPCKATPSFREFDFWIGEWDAKNVQGVTVGSSSIQLILGQCIIFENWSTPVSSGKSFNIFNSTDKKWHQTWVDDKGTFTHYVGGLVDGKMVLDSEQMANGKKGIGRMTFSKLPNGDVRQHGENSTDEGKTWTTTFDLTYVRKK